MKDFFQKIERDYDGNCQNLKSFIQVHFKDCDLIDYERVIQEHERGSKTLSGKEVEDDLEKERQRIWRFLSENVIMATNLNRHQEIIKIHAQKNVQRKHDRKMKE